MKGTVIFICTVQVRNYKFFGLSGISIIADFFQFNVQIFITSCPDVRIRLKRLLKINLKL